MKKAVLVLICSLPLCSSIPMQKNITKTQFSGMPKKISPQQWLASTQKLNNEYKEKLISFLDSINNILPDLPSDRREAVDNAIDEILAHTKYQIHKIKQIAKIKKSIPQEEESFSLERVIQKSTNSQGSDRLNMSMALKEITIDDSGLLRTVQHIDNSIKYANEEHIVEATEEIEKYLQILTQFQLLMKNDFKNSAQLSLKLMKKIENPQEEIQAQSLSKSSINVRMKLQNLWQSIVNAFKKHY